MILVEVKCSRPHASLKGLVTCCLYCSHGVFGLKCQPFLDLSSLCACFSCVIFVAGIFTDCCKKHWPFVVCCREKTKVYCNIEYDGVQCTVFFQITYYMYYVV